jgi:hypothetical protein
MRIKLLTNGHYGSPLDATIGKVVLAKVDQDNCATVSMGTLWKAGADKELLKNEPNYRLLYWPEEFEAVK